MDAAIALIFMFRAEDLYVAIHDAKAPKPVMVKFDDYFRRVDAEAHKAQSLCAVM